MRMEGLLIARQTVAAVSGLLFASVWSPDLRVLDDQLSPHYVDVVAAAADAMFDESRPTTAELSKGK